ANPVTWRLNYDFTALNDGDVVNYNVVATDNAGNQSTVASGSFTVDKTPPTVTLTGPTNGQVVKTPVNLQLTVTDNDPGTVYIVYGDDQVLTQGTGNSI